MTQEDKELLLKDLSARLPYKVIGKYSWKGRKSYNKELTGNLYDELKSSWDSTEDSKFLPYLRPMSSMTEGEKVDYQAFFNYNGVEYPEEYIDWCNKNHFDYRGLIPKGLAIAVTEENNPYK